MRKLFVLVLFIVCIQEFKTVNAQNKNGRPNIILIISDDMGFSDIGCYGSEINTPNLDRLGMEGLRYTQFYNMDHCAPSRAALLTGLYPHQTGMGWMPGKSFGLPGYEGELNNRCVTIAEVFQSAGYATFMTGKWHLTNNTKAGGARYNWPLQRGFDKFYGILGYSGACCPPLPEGKIIKTPY